MDVFLTNMQGETKKHVEALMAQLGEAQDLLEEKERLEREAADEIASLTQAHEEEHNLRVTLEESVLNLEVSNNLNISKLTKERDHALALVNVLKKEKLSLEVGHAKLLKDSAILDEAHKALKREFASLSKSCGQPQMEASKEKEVEVLDSTNPCCEHLKEIDRLNAKMAGLLTLALAKEGSSNEGLVDAPKPKRKKRKNKKNKGVACETGDSSPRRGGMPGPTSRGYAGANNPSHVLFVDYYGYVRARFVGPYEENVDWTIWVPKPLVANMIEPIAKWVPKTKK